MAEYLIIAETIVFKNDRLTCINIHENFKTIAMPAEFNFDMAIICGPKWSVGEHKISVKVKASNGKEVYLGDATVNIPHEDFVYNAFLNNIKFAMDYSVSDLTFYVYDNDKEVFSRKYLVIPMLVPQKKAAPQVAAEEAKAANKEVKDVNEEDKKDKKKK